MPRLFGRELQRTRPAPQPGHWSYREHGRYHHYSIINQFHVCEKIRWMAGVGALNEMVADDRIFHDPLAALPQGGGF
jgi:hypothetical protein